MPVSNFHEQSCAVISCLQFERLQIWINDASVSFWCSKSRLRRKYFLNTADRVVMCRARPDSILEVAVVLWEIKLASLISGLCMHSVFVYC